jgi:hypothetical protein
MKFYSPKRIILYTAAAIALVIIIGLVTHFTVSHLAA